MRRIHVVGRRNAGKTALVVELVAELRRRGLTVGTIKHSGHVHEIDTPGKDSWRHREAGGRPAAVVTPDTLAVFVDRLPDQDPYADLEPLYRGCDLVLVEGDHTATGADKLEVWRAATASPPIATERDDIRAVITDDPIEVDIPTWPRADVAAIADRLV